jgi:hypothetical protein
MNHIGTPVLIAKSKRLSSRVSGHPGKEMVVSSSDRSGNG